MLLRLTLTGRPSSFSQRPQGAAGHLKSHLGTSYLGHPQTQGHARVKNNSETRILVHEGKEVVVAFDQIGEDALGSGVVLLVFQVVAGRHDRGSLLAALAREHLGLPDHPLRRDLRRRGWCECPGSRANGYRDYADAQRPQRLHHRNTPMQLTARPKGIVLGKCGLSFGERAVLSRRACEIMGTGTSEWHDSPGSTHGAAEPVPISSQTRSERRLYSALTTSNGMAGNGPMKVRYSRVFPSLLVSVLF